MVKATVPDVNDIDSNVSTTEADLFYHHNSLGSVAAVTDLDGDVVEEYSYTAYGELTVDTKLGTTTGTGTATRVAQPFGFTGRRHDYEEGSGLYYYRLRYYDPVAGRFVSRDPLGLWGDPGQRGNGQSYCGANPVNRVDPLGLDDKWPPGPKKGTAKDLKAWSNALKGWGLPHKWLDNLIEKDDLAIYADTTKWLVDEGGQPGAAGYDPFHNAIVLTHWFFDPKTGKIKTPADFLSGNTDEKFNQVAAVFQESFHAWFDQVAGSSWWLTNDEPLSSYVQELIMGWLRLDELVKCGKSTKEEAKEVWTKVVVPSAQNQAGSAENVDALKEEGLDFEKLIPGQK